MSKFPAEFVLHYDKYIVMLETLLLFC